jgi:hypothetical protein
MNEYNLSLRDLYRGLDFPGRHPLKDAQHKLDEAVKAAYNMPKSYDALTFLFNLNQQLAKKEQTGQLVIGPGLPPFVEYTEDYVSDDCIHMS